MPDKRANRTSETIILRHTSLRRKSYTRRHPSNHSAGHAPATAKVFWDKWNERKYNFLPYFYPLDKSHCGDP